MKSTLLIFAGVFLLSHSVIQAQSTRRALFLGNSYTNYNNLPQLTSDVALSAGDTLIVSSNTPGGTSFDDHLVNATSMSLIAQGNWDFVVLQQQSQMPAFPIEQVEIETFPFATQLSDTISFSNPCAETMFYMTWGRENGDAQNCAIWPPVCTYEGMDDLLYERYMMMAEMNNDLVSPVGAVWRNIRTNHPEIDLYADDGSHPSPAGSYAAALCFYSCMFRKSPLLATYNYTVDDAVEATIRNAVHEVVYNNLSTWYIGMYDPQAALVALDNGDGTFTLQNNSQNSEEYLISVDGSPYEVWPANESSFTVNAPADAIISFIAVSCNESDTLETTLSAIDNAVEDLQSLQIRFSPNPVSDLLTLRSGRMVLTSFKLVSSDGRLVREGQFQGSTEIDLRNEANGVYFLITSSDQRSRKSQRIVVAHD